MSQLTLQMFQWTPTLAGWDVTIDGWKICTTVLYRRLTVELFQWTPTLASWMFQWTVNLSQLTVRCTIALTKCPTGRRWSHLTDDWNVTIDGWKFVPMNGSWLLTAKMYHCTPTIDGEINYSVSNNWPWDVPLDYRTDLFHSDDERFVPLNGANNWKRTQLFSFK